MKEEKMVIRGVRQKMTARSFSIGVQEEENLSRCNEVTVLATAHAPVQSKDRSCVLCGRSHILESCGQFHKMKLVERKIFRRNESDSMHHCMRRQLCRGAISPL